MAAGPEIIFLGTNGWYDTPTGNTVCALIRTRRRDVILDAGNGLYKAPDFIDGKKPVFVFLSHFHIDHIAGLHLLLKFRDFRGTMTICGQKGTRKILKTFLNKPFTMPPSGLKYKVKVLELPSEAAKLPFEVETLPLLHADPVLGFRLKLDGRAVAYCTDTGYCPNALKLARGADLLITECAHAPGESNPGWPHFNPETAGRLAAEAGAKRLVMTHFSADRYRTMAARRAAIKITRKFFRNALAAKDGLKLKLR